MMRFKIAADGLGLCGACRNAFIRRYDDGGADVVCSLPYPDVRIARRVVACSDFNPNGRMDLQEMQDAAWILELDKDTGKIGFKSPETRRE
jgi:hypothetical protein